ncbi:hypothetical protein [Pseudonocardia hydrocarbonoxydans]|uniref:Uncharacterized protein n=1 Tax=Pseudonocardia hydrocarbonoxydans TaxID=76726 RepID=A0A4Y3WXE1_9PSEU|nr:hypothetical protein [Pseudonocardia hydrocarbonoxydans]GEC22790.1 hypothetical protein PHY01_50730 [Pseudonocardia hydrocarbonoxydans]
MGAVGLLIFFAIVGAAICAKARVAGGAIVFALLALVLFIGTPAGAGLPGMVADFLATVGAASEPLTEGSGAVG